MKLKPGLAVAIMVRNDAVRLKRCLDSIKGLAEAIVVLDTGSADDSVSVAREAGATVFETTWPDAFDLALNQLLDKIEYEWTFRIDSDEWLPESEHAKVLAEITEPNVGMVIVLRRDFGQEGHHADIEQQRLWRTDPAMRVRGVIHEQFWPDILDSGLHGRTIKRSTITLHHDGFAQGLTPEKLERNLKLIEKELEIRPGQPFYEVCLMDTLGNLGDPRATVMIEKLIDETVGKNRPPDDLLVVIPMIKYLAVLPAENCRSPRIGKVIRYALSFLGDIPMVLWTMAVLEVKRENKRAALDILLQLEKLGESGQYSRVLSVNPMILTRGCWASIVEIGQELGRGDLVTKYQAKLAAIR